MHTRHYHDNPELQALAEAVIKADSEEVVRLLESSDLITPEALAALCGSPGEWWNVYLNAIRYGIEPFVKKVLEGGLKPGYYDELAAAARGGRAGLARLLLYCGANPDVDSDRGVPVRDMCSNRETAEVLAQYREGKAAEFPVFDVPDADYEQRDAEAQDSLYKWRVSQGVITPPEIIEEVIRPTIFQLLMSVVIALALATAMTGLFVFFVDDPGAFDWLLPALVAYALANAWLVNKCLPGKYKGAVRHVLWLILVLMPVTGGHWGAYSYYKTSIHEMVSLDKRQYYPEAWASLSEDEVYTLWLKKEVHSSLEGGFLDSLRARAAIGWQGLRGAKSLRHFEDVSGWAMWAEWLLQIVLIAIAAAFSVYGRVFRSSA